MRNWTPKLPVQNLIEKWRGQALIATLAPNVLIMETYENP